MPTRITFFEVPPEADEAFLAAWARDGAGALWRALREDAAYRFLALEAADDGPDLYEVVGESDRPDVDGGVLLVEPVADAAAWAQAREGLLRHRGYIGRRLYRGLEGGEHLGIARWSSPLMIQRAKQSGTVYG